MSNVITFYLSPTDIFIFFCNIKSTLEAPRIMFQGINTMFSILRTVKIYQNNIQNTHLEQVKIFWR